MTEGHVAANSDSTSTQAAGSTPSNRSSGTGNSNLAPEGTSKEETETTILLQALFSQMADMSKLFKLLTDTDRVKIKIVEAHQFIQASLSSRTPSSKFLKDTRTL